MANRRFAVRASKRRTTWEGANIDLTDLTNGTAQFVTVISEANLEQFPNPTIVRTRGRMMLSSDPSSTPGGFGELSVGLIVVNTTAAAAGPTALPSPAGDIGSDFFYWDVFTFGAPAADVLGDTGSIDRHVVDSKAMRKIGPNQVVVMIAELTTCEGVLVCNLCGALRILLKAP